MLKETETEETIVFFYRISIIGGISIGGLGPPGYAYDPKPTVLQLLNTSKNMGLLGSYFAMLNGMVLFYQDDQP